MVPVYQYIPVYHIIIFVDITVNPKENTTVAKGTDVTLTCNASVADNLRYQWMRMGKKIIPSRAMGVNSSTLIIPDITVEDNGEYYCVVSSGDITVTSNPGSVSVFSVLSKLLAYIFYTSTVHYHKEHQLCNSFLVDVKSSVI